MNFWWLNSQSVVFCFGSQADYSSYMPEHSGLLRGRSSIWSRVDVSIGQPVNSGMHLWRPLQAELLVQAAICCPFPCAIQGRCRILPQKTCHLQVSDFSSTSNTRIHETWVPPLSGRLYSGVDVLQSLGVCMEAQRGCAPQHGKAACKRTGLHKQEKEALRADWAHPGAGSTQKILCAHHLHHSTDLERGCTNEKARVISHPKSKGQNCSHQFVSLQFSEVEIVLYVFHILLSWNLIPQIFPMTVSLFSKTWEK